MARGRDDLFPPDRGLQARMVFALAVDALLALLFLLIFGGLIAIWISVDGPWETVFAFLVFPACFVFVGLVASFQRRGESSWNSREATPEDGERLRAATDRLCLVAEMEPPETRVVGDRIPLSWLSARLWRRPRLTVTTGMLDLLPEPELRAVVGHELTHLAQHDALVMGLLSAPSRWTLRGAREMFSDDPWRAPFAFIYAIYFLLPMIVLALMARVVSRHRELSADRGAAVLTGSAAAMASALRRVAEDLRIGDMLKSDLKRAAAGNELHVLPAARREPTGLRRMWATHPPIARRLEQLDEMERDLQASRGSPVAALAADPAID